MQNNTTVAGLNLLAPGFQDVGLTSIKLTGLKVTNAEGGEVATTGANAISLIDENGNPLVNYTWSSSGRVNKTWGWQVGGNAIDDNVVFARGVGLLFSAEGEGYVLSSQGEVNLEGITISETVAGLNVVANPYPTPVKLVDLIVTNAEGGEVATTGANAISLIDENGNPLVNYTWSSSGRVNKTWGWQVGGNAIDDSVTIAPGQAVLFTAEQAGYKLTFPAQQ